jgi:hypothetical protein
VESLHPIEPRNFDVTADRIVYVAEARGRDRLVVQRLEHEATEQSGPGPGEPEIGQGIIDLPLRDPGKETWWKVKIKRRDRQRIRLDREGIVAVGSVAVEPAGDRIAFVGLSAAGTRDLYVTDGTAVRRLTDDVAAERDVAWGPGGLVYASDASADGTMQLFRLDPDGTAPPVGLTDAGRDQHSPVVLPDGTIVYAGFEDDKSALYAQYEDSTTRLTDLATGAFEPSIAPDGGLWAMVLNRGRMRPSRIPSDALRGLPADLPPGAAGPPLQFPTRAVDDATPYRPLDIRNWTIDGGFAALGAGAGGVYGQLYLSFSDRLRDHALIVIAQAYGRPELTDAQVIYLDEQARVSWGGGPFHSLRFRIDRSVDDVPFLYQSTERYYGVLGTVRYPFDRFVYAQTDLSVGGVSYFLYDSTRALLANPVDNGTGRNLLLEWQDNNDFPRFQTEAALRLGVDTIRYHPKTGPVAGTSALIEASGGLQPFDDEVFASLRLDAQQYLPIPFVSGGNVGLRASAATSGGGDYAIGYWLSSYDTLRAYSWGDPDLLGRHYWFANAELQVPLDVLVRLAVASGIEGVVGLDVGAVADDLGDLWDNRVLDAALGTNFVLGPLVLRLHFARAIDIGAPLPVTSRPWVTNFSISWLGL